MVLRMTLCTTCKGTGKNFVSNAVSNVKNLCAQWQISVD